MKKPYGTLEVSTDTVLGAGGSFSFNPFTTSDDHGNRFGGAIPGADLIEAYFVVLGFATPDANAGKCTVNKIPTVVGGLLTGLVVVLTNESPAANDRLFGFLYVRIWNRANMAI